MSVPAFSRTLRNVAVLGFGCASASVSAAVAHESWPAVQAEYEEVVVACRKLPPDRDRDCVEQAKKKYGEILRSKS